MPVFPSIEWARALQDLANSSEELRKIGSDWEAGGVILIAEAEEGKLPQNHYLYVLYHKGELKEVRELKSPDEIEAPFTISAKYSIWKEIIKGEQDAITALMKGLVKVKGNVQILLKYAKFSKTFFSYLQKVETKFIDEV